MRSLRVLILGNKGQLGTELHRAFAACTTFGYDRAEIDVADSASVRILIDETQPDLILNASAYTAVDRAESEPELAMAINGRAPGILAEEALRHKALFVHYSTDYVFDGTKAGPWTEDDVPNPLNVYGRSKLEGECAVQRIGGRYLIFRTSWVYGPHGNNFMLTMLRLGRERRELRVVDDQIGAPTTSSALADATHDAVRWILGHEAADPAEWAGLYHMTCGGSTSWCGFARAILNKAMGELAPKIIGITSEEYLTAARRPKNSVLNNQRLQSMLGIALPDWSVALNEALAGCRVKSAGA